MKGKIFVGLLLGILGAIYAFLVYPLLQNATSSDPIAEEESGLPCLVGAGNGVFAQSASDNCIATQENDLGDSSPNALQVESAEPQICFQSTCFTIEIADTFASRQQGLMNRESLPQDAGMLFVFDAPGSYGFWMKNTLIPLDIIRLDQNLVVVDTTTMTPCIADPCQTYNHRGQALYALEINAGLLQEYGIVAGMQFDR